MAAPAIRSPHGITYEEFLTTTEEGTHAEWVDGEVVPMSPASERHAAVSTFLAAVLRGFTKRKGMGGRVLHAPFQMKLGPRLPGREPDVLYVAEHRLGRLRGTYLDGPADLVVEVVSPESQQRDRTVKFHEYREAGVREYWLVDPVRRTAEVHRLAPSGDYRLADPGEPPRLRSEVIPGFWIDPTWLWADDPDEWQAYEQWGLV